jgi:hypothetical protein
MEFLLRGVEMRRWRLHPVAEAITLVGLAALILAAGAAWIQTLP